MNKSRSTPVLANLPFINPHSDFFGWCIFSLVRFPYDPINSLCRQQFHTSSLKSLLWIESKHICMINVCGYTEILPYMYMLNYGISSVLWALFALKKNSSRRKLPRRSQTGMVNSRVCRSTSLYKKITKAERHMLASDWAQIYFLCPIRD